MKIKHSERLRSAVYLRNPEPVCVVREMHDAPSNEFVAMHDHEFSEFVLVASGSLRHLHSGGTDQLAAGDFFVIHPGERHGYAEFSRRTLVFNLLYNHAKPPPAPLLLFGSFPLMDAVFPRSSVTKRADVLGHLHKTELGHVVSLMRELRHVVQNRLPQSRALGEMLFSAILLFLARSSREALPQTVSVQPEINFILANLHRKITLADLRGVSGRSVSTLTREFRKAVGTSPGDYILVLRAARARALLSSGTATLNDVAARTGFCHAGHLLRTLRSHEETSAPI